MTDWAAFTLAMLAFLSSHFVPRLWGPRETLIARFGRRSYFSAYGVVSLFLLAWVIIAAGRAPFVELWPQQPWMRWLPNLVVPLACILTTCGFGVANPETLGGSASRAFDPENPGFAAVSRHPLLLGLLLWATAHLIVNGDLAHVVLFASFAAFPLIAIWGFDRKTRRRLGPDADRFFDQTSVLSLRPLIQRHWLRQNAGQLLRRVLAGLLIWILLLHSHMHIIGAWPFP